MSARWWPRAEIANSQQHRLEVAASLSTALLGLWLIYSGALGIPPLAYTFLSTLAPLWLWGAVLLLVSGLCLSGIGLGRPRLRQLALLAMFAGRLALLGAVWHGTSFTSNTIPEHIAWLCVSAWAYLRASDPAAQ